MLSRFGFEINKIQRQLMETSFRTSQAKTSVLPIIDNNHKNFAKFYMRPQNGNSNGTQKVNSDNKISWHENFNDLNKDIGGFEMEKINIEELRYFTDLIDYDLEKTMKQKSGNGSNNGNSNGNKMSAAGAYSSSTKSSSSQEEAIYDKSGFQNIKDSKPFIDIEDEFDGYFEPQPRSGDGVRITYKV